MFDFIAVLCVLVHGQVALSATATICNINLDKERKNIYIQSARLNCEEYTKNWIGHEFFTQGWELELVVGDTESDWGTRVEDRPPSMSTSGEGMK
jgi:putative alpha-1,2-mannosidase